MHAAPATIPTTSSPADPAALPDTARHAAASTRASARRALESYASWLFYERRLLCLELYPDVGASAEGFVTVFNAGFEWHFRAPDGRSWQDLPPPSTRAEAVLALVGVDWAGHSERRVVHIRDGSKQAPVAASWRHPDAEVIDAARKVVALEAAHETLRRKDEESPRLGGIAHTREKQILFLANAPCLTLDGLRAKAEAMRAGLRDRAASATRLKPAEQLAWSLADDLLTVSAASETDP